MNGLEALKQLKSLNQSGDKHLYFEAIEKDLKVLELLKNKRVSVFFHGKLEFFTDGTHLDENETNIIKEYFIDEAKSNDNK